MDDFYDTDIGVQTSDILVLPSAFLGTLWTELQRLGNDKARNIMFKWPRRNLQRMIWNLSATALELH